MTENNHRFEHQNGNNVSGLFNPLPRERASEVKALDVLLIEDDEDDYVLFRDIVSDIANPSITLDWVDSYHAGIEAVKCDTHDIYIIDFRLQYKNGLELVHEIKQWGCRKPIILLTGQGDRRIDLQAMREGVADYLEKDQLNPYLLERTFRYCLDRHKTLETLRHSKRQLRFLSEKLIETQEAERKRIAGELHDSIGSTLAAIKFGLEKQRRDEIQRSGAQESPLSSLIDMTKDAMAEVQRIYSELRPLVLDEMGILSAIHWYCRKFKQVYGHIRIDQTLEVDEDQILDPLKIVIYRILQEALNNTVKHTRADRARIALSLDGDGIKLRITDNGEGFDVERVLAGASSGSGMGLISMKERIEFSGGSFNLWSGNGQGTTIQAVWPLI